MPLTCQWASHQLPFWVFVNSAQKTEHRSDGMCVSVSVTHNLFHQHCFLFVWLWNQLRVISYLGREIRVDRGGRRQLSWKGIQGAFMKTESLSRLTSEGQVLARQPLPWKSVWDAGRAPNCATHPILKTSWGHFSCGVLPASSEYPTHAACWVLWCARPGPA